VTFAVALPAELAAVTAKVWKPRRRPLKESGEEHGVTAVPSSVHVTLVGELVVVHANVAGFCRFRGLCVNVTVGLLTGADVIVQAWVALLEPAVLATRSTKLWAPAVRAL
jgi:hypothetical protein